MDEGNQYFRADPRAAVALPAVARRGSGLRPKADIWWWLGLHAYVDAVPRAQRDYKTGSFGAPAVTVPFSASQLTAAMRLAPSQAVSRDLSAAMVRLAKAEVAFEYTRWERGAGVVADTFEGNLITRPDDRADLLTLHCYPPPSSRYYLLLSSRLFDLRTEVGETATSLLLWLCFQHRGKSTSAGFRHREHLELTPAAVESIGVVKVRQGHRREAYARVLAALDELQQARVVQLNPQSGPKVHVSFCSDYFHTGAAR